MSSYTSTNPDTQAPDEAIKTPIVGYATRLGLDQVDLFVGREKRQLRVSKAIICSKIPYFDKMFNGGFKEAQDQSATFPEDSLDDFELLIEWVYTGSYPQFEGEYPATMAPAFMGVYCLAEKLCLPALADYSMTSLRNQYLKTAHYPSMDIIEIAYTRSAPGSSLRRYIARSVHHAIKKSPDTSQDYSPESLSVFLARFPELLEDVIVLMRDMELVERAAGCDDLLKSPRFMLICDFHQHARDEPFTFVKTKVTSSSIH